MKRKTINRNISHMAYYSNAEVRQFGRIFPWGGFRILNGKDDDPSDNNSGLFCWCEELTQYPNEKYAAHMTVEHLIILQRSTNEVVDQFHLYGDYTEVFVPDVQFLKIDSIGKLERLRKEDVCWDHALFSFGIQYYDLEVIKLSFHGHLKPLEQTVPEDYLIITMKGENVPFCFNVKNLQKELG